MDFDGDGSKGNRFKKDYGRKTLPSTFGSHFVQWVVLYSSKLVFIYFYILIKNAMLNYKLVLKILLREGLVILSNNLPRHT